MFHLEGSVTVELNHIQEADSVTFFFHILCLVISGDENSLPVLINHVGLCTVGFITKFSREEPRKEVFGVYDLIVL